MPEPDIAGLRQLADRIAALTPAQFDWESIARNPHQAIGQTCPLCIAGWAAYWSSHNYLGTLGDYILERFHLPASLSNAIVYGFDHRGLTPAPWYTPDNNSRNPLVAAQRIREVCDLLTA